MSVISGYKSLEMPDMSISIAESGDTGLKAKHGQDGCGEGHSE